MKKSSILPIALIGAGVYFLATKTVNAAQLMGKLSVLGGKIKKVSFQGLFAVDIKVELQINNTGSVAIPMEYYTGSVSHAGTKLTDFTFNGTGQNVNIQPRGVTPLTFNLSVKTINLVAKLVKLAKDILDRKPVITTLDINSNFYAGGFDIPVNFTHDLKPAILSSVGALNLDITHFRKPKRRIIDVLQAARVKKGLAPINFNPATVDNPNCYCPKSVYGI